MVFSGFMKNYVKVTEMWNLLKLTLSVAAIQTYNTAMYLLCNLFIYYFLKVDLHSFFDLYAVNWAEPPIYTVDQKLKFWNHFMFNLDPTPPPPPPSGGACFPAAEKVKIENGPLVTMLDLKIGDKVQIGITRNILWNQ